MTNCLRQELFFDGSPNTGMLLFSRSHHCLDTWQINLYLGNVNTSIHHFSEGFGHLRRLYIINTSVFSPLEIFFCLLGLRLNWWGFLSVTDFRQAVSHVMIIFVRRYWARDGKFELTLLLFSFKHLFHNTFYSVPSFSFQNEVFNLCN